MRKRWRCARALLQSYARSSCASSMPSAIFACTLSAQPRIRTSVRSAPRRTCGNSYTHKWRSGAACHVGCSKVQRSARSYAAHVCVVLLKVRVRGYVCTVRIRARLE